MSAIPARRRRAMPASLLLGFVLGLLCAGSAALLGLGPFLRHRNDLPLERVLAEVTKELAVPRDASTRAPTVRLDDPQVLARGRTAYTASCAACHGAAGEGRGAFGPGLYPDATDLRAHDTQEKSDGALFWIVKNGLSFEGMPAFAGRYGDDDIWALVGYIRVLGKGR